MCPPFASPGLSHPFSIDIFEDYIYGVTYINNRIFKIHKFGHKSVTNLTSGLNHATDVVLYHQYKQPEGACWARGPWSGGRVRCQKGRGERRQRTRLLSSSLSDRGGRRGAPWSAKQGVHVELEGSYPGALESCRLVT